MTFQELLTDEREAGRAEGRAEGHTIGYEEAEAKLSKLIQTLLDDGLTDAIAAVTSDKQVREEYYAKYDIK